MGVAPGETIYCQTGVVVPSALVIFISCDGYIDVEPVTLAFEASCGRVTLRFEVMAGVINCGAGDTGSFARCWMLITGFPFASLLPVATGRPLVAVPDAVLPL